ncbi:hypothetical protein [Acinetobacter seifertii]|uniref:hypothetical protein n=1 Tax=Acinetobacter seifertii TaxID=1530123 RepID=UPI0032B3460E
MKKLILILTIFSTTVFANEQPRIDQNNIKQIEQEQKSKQQKAFEDGINFAKENKEKIIQKQEYKDGEKFAKEMCEQYPIQCNIKK